MPSKEFCKCCSTRKTFTICFAVAGIVLLILGLVLSVGGVFSKLIREQVDEEVQLKPGSLVYKEWTKTTIPIYMQYFMFNLTNPDEVMDGAIPNVTQIGPYSYRELRSNEVLNWTSDKSIVTFMPNRTYIFDPETSCAGCDDRNDSFVTVNIPLLTVALKLKNTDLTNYTQCLSLLQIVADAFEVKLFQRKKVHEFLWGYTDALLNTIVNLETSACPSSAAKGVKAFVQLQYNNTYYGISAVSTGQVDIKTLEQFTMWRGASHLSFWSDKYANMINGTDGTQFAPRVSKDDKLYVFIPDVCRATHLTYESTENVKKIEVYRFTAPDEVYLSGDVYPPNKGFCVPPGCLPTGLLNISLCQPMNPPVAVSPPHFYQSNKSLLETVNGLNPMKSEHGTYLDVEPMPIGCTQSYYGKGHRPTSNCYTLSSDLGLGCLCLNCFQVHTNDTYAFSFEHAHIWITGIVMQAAKRIQINVALESVCTITQTTGKFKPVFLPVMFINENALISDEKADEFRSKVYSAIKLTKLVQYFLIALGLLCILVTFVLIFMMVFDGETGSDDEKASLLSKQEINKE